MEDAGLMRQSRAHGRDDAMISATGREIERIRPLVASEAHDRVCAHFAMRQPFSVGVKTTTEVKTMMERNGVAHGQPPRWRTRAHAPPRARPRTPLDGTAFQCAGPLARLGADKRSLPTNRDRETSAAEPRRLVPPACLQADQDLVDHL